MYIFLHTFKYSKSLRCWSQAHREEGENCFCMGLLTAMSITPRNHLCPASGHAHAHCVLPPAMLTFGIVGNYPRETIEAPPFFRTATLSKRFEKGYMGANVESIAKQCPFLRPEPIMTWLFLSDSTVNINKGTQATIHKGHLGHQKTSC